MPSRWSPPLPVYENHGKARIEVLEGLEPVRRRPGMYIGGTDEKALHHLFAEVIDNSMDEAVAGHATFIEVELDADGYLSVTDNGRGIPVDPHPKFKDKSALEVILTDAARRRQVRQQGLRDVRRPAWRRRVGGQRAVRASGGGGRPQPTLYRQRILARPAADEADRTNLGEIHNRRGTRVRFQPDEKIFGKGAKFEPARLYKMARSKAYLFGGVEIRWSATRCTWRRTETPQKAVFHFPGGLKDYLDEAIQGDRPRVTDEIFAGKSPSPRRPRLGRMGDGVAGGEASSTPTATPCPRPRAARTRRACAPR
jgi:topoisomerase-4 subunit B